MHLVHEFIPSGENGRNSEGSFVRLPSGRILFAYSRFIEAGGGDGDRCDIALAHSDDEGESWSEPVVIAKAADFGTRNLMSVSSAIQRDGRIAFYFIIKENDGSTTIGRALTSDGSTFEISRCALDAPQAYYVFNNDRLVRLSDGRLAYPAGRHISGLGKNGKILFESWSVSVVFVSEDDGATFSLLPPRLTVPALGDGPAGELGRRAGMQEPGLVELRDGTIWLWARTGLGGQYECLSRDGMRTFTMPQPSRFFTGPCSPLEVARDEATGALYAAFNPVPPYTAREIDPFTWGRTPFVLSKSLDDGRTWSRPVIVEDDPHRGYCYPAFFFTRDNALLLAYCRGGHECANCLCRLGLMKIALSEIP